MGTVFIIYTALLLSIASSSTATTSRQYFAHPKDAHPDVTPYIIGGAEVVPHSYPFQLALTIWKGTDSFICGGTLISHWWVLTAAHCVDMKPDFISVLLGDHDLTSIHTPMEKMDSTDYIIHEDWNEDGHQNDVALVKLPQAATFNEYIQPVQLANGSDTYVGKEGTIIGWGQTETAAMSFVLKSVNSTVLSNDECANANDIYKKVIQPTHICTLGPGMVGSCNGDSGGPLLVNGVQVGIVSFGAANCEPELPSVFTRVTDFHDWIVEHAVGGATYLHPIQLLSIVLTSLCFKCFLIQW